MTEKKSEYRNTKFETKANVEHRTSNPPTAGQHWTFNGGQKTEDGGPRAEKKSEYRNTKFETKANVEHRTSKIEHSTEDELRSISFEVEGLRWKGKFDGLGLETLHNLEIHPFIHLVIEPVVRRFDPVNHIKVQRTVVKIAEIYSRRIFGVGVYFGSAGKDVFYDLDGTFRFIVARVVGYRDVCSPPDERPLADVFDK